MPTQNWIVTIINNFLNIVVWPVFIGLAVIMFIWAGILFLTANGEPGKIAEARKAVIWGIVGIIVAIIAFSAVGLVQTIITPPVQQAQNDPCNGTCSQGQTCDTSNPAAPTCI